jgi:hypothetical protein
MDDDVLNNNFESDEYGGQEGDIEQEDASGRPELAIEDELKTLEATPGFISGELRNSSNPDARKKHEEILRKRSELVARQHAKPPVSPEDVTPEAQEAIKKEIEKIEDVDGFMDGRLRTSSNPDDHAKHAELLGRRSKLISRLLPDENPADMKALHEQSSRLSRAKQDMDELAKFHGYERAKIPRNLTERQATGLHLQLLSARGRFEEFAEYASSVRKRCGLKDEEVLAINSLAKLNADSAKKRNLLDDLLLTIFGKD